jgi:hypothetical protein
MKRKLFFQQGDQLYKVLLRKLVILLLYILTTAVVLFIFIVRPGINLYFRTKFPDMVYGQAYKPFVYRTLVPTTIRIAAEITPESVKDRISSTVGHKRKRMISMLQWETEYVYEYQIALIIMFCSFLGFAFALRYLIRLFYDFPSFVADLAPVGGLLILPGFFKNFNQIYDPSTLFLFALAIIFIAKRKLLPFYVVFLLATLNKETSILLAGVFFIREFKVMRNWRLAGHLLLQISIFTAVKAWITAVFKNNPGSFCEFHLTANTLGLMSKPYLLAHCIILVAVFSALLHYRWSEKPVLLRHGFLVTIIPLVSLALFFGLINELRDYYEAFPFLFLLSLPTIVDIFGSSHDDGHGRYAKELPGKKENGLTL